MRFTIAVAVVMLLAGCATHERTKAQSGYFLFDADPQTGLWRTREGDFIEIAKAYVKKNKVRFDFENASARLRIFEKDGALIARVQFGRKFGFPWLAVDLDAAGKPIQYSLGSEDNGDL